MELTDIYTFTLLIITTLLIPCGSGQLQLDTFKRNPELVNRQCRNEETLFLKNSVRSALLCVANCHTDFECRGVFYNSENMICEGCTEDYENATDLLQNTGTIYLGEGRKELNGSFYKFATKMVFNEANDYCKSFDGYILQVDSEEEQQFIVDNFGDAHAIWLGITDERQEGVWEWFTYNSTTGYENWKSTGGPYQQFDRPDENCAVINARTEFGWGDRDCNKPMYVVCEF